MPRILTVAATFYRDIADALIHGSETVLEEQGCFSELIEVPGALEIPAAIAMAADSGHFDGYVALGCVIRGETTHYDTVCNESARGINELAIFRRLPIGNGIITVENREQAMERAKADKKDKGGDAARACLAMLRLKQRFGADSA